ncbi:MAG TPA: hypothetical protein VNA89_16280 [Gemmatimonadaceae bacterium]|nr:hypothetical protein [Gemmatimonadaceae bacterium]
MAQPQERRPPRSAEYYYRRSLGARDLIPAVVAGVGAGLLAFYVARLLAERTPLVVERGTRPAGDGTPARERGVGTRRSG